MKLSRTFWRYSAFQIPGWIFVGVLTWWLYKIAWLSPWQSFGLFALWFVKDFALYPFLKSAYAPSTEKNRSPLIGKVGVVVDPFTPLGYVKIEGERWKAKSFDQGASPPSIGDQVLIKDVESFTLLVEFLDDSEDSLPTSDRL